MLIALAGNPNTGKTTIFNSLTGMKQHVGNWPGVTVEKKEGYTEISGKKVHVVDLPGTYSLSAYTPEELITRNFIIEEKPDVILDIVDASNLERNLYLFTELLELTQNIILVLNMYDEAQKKYDIDLDKMRKMLGIPIVPAVGIKGKGIDEIKKMITDGKFQARGVEYPEDIEKRIKLLEDKIKALGLEPARWHAIKLIENDAEVLKKIGTLSHDVAHMAEHLRHEIVDIYGDDIESIMASVRYSFAHGLFHEVAAPINVGGVTITDMLDHVLTHKYFGLPIFAAIMYLAFQFVFLVATPFQDAIDLIFNGKNVAGGHINGLVDLSYAWMSTFMPNWLASLINHGMLRGLGAVLTFMPLIMLLFLILSFLEDSGYLARVAFLMDSIMKKIGLEGRGVIPIMLGFGCNVPAIMATRTLKDEKERKLSIALNPLIPCGARIQVFAFLSYIFFPQNAAVVLWSLLLLSIVVVFVLGFVYSRTLLKGEHEPFVLELPPYRIPTLKGISIHMWEKSEGFLRKAGTIIIGAAAIIWVFAALPWGVEYGSPESYIGMLASFLAPLGTHIGLTPEAIIALFFGFFAKEVVIDVLYVLYRSKEAIAAAMTPLQAYSFMLFMLFYTPCVATLASIYGETKSKKFLAMVILQGFLIAVAFSLVAFAVGTALGVGT